MTLPERPVAVDGENLAAWRSAIEQLVGDQAKVEILGGGIIVSPLARTLHDKIVSRLHAVFVRVLDEDTYDVSQRIEFVVDELNSPQPDLALISTQLRNDTLDATEYAAKEALLVVEVTSPSNGANDRKWGIKYKAYAKGLVPVYLLVDPYAASGPEIRLFTGPTGTRYNTEKTVSFGDELRLPEPFDAVVIDSSRFPLPGS